MQEVGIVKSGPLVMIVHDTTSDRDYVLRGAAAMTSDLRKLDTISRKKYGDQLDVPVCVCGFEKALLAGELFYLGELVRAAWIVSRNYPHTSLFIAEWSSSSLLLSF